MADLATRVMVESPVERLQGDGDELYDTVIYWHGDSCVEPSPYRKIVRWIIAELRKSYSVEVLHETEEMEGEDFVFHEIAVDGRKLTIYWENSLGFISFISADAALIEQLSKHLAGKKPEIA
jgi:hypothetical protein